MKGGEVEPVKGIERSAHLKLWADSLWQCATREGCEKLEQVKKSANRLLLALVGSLDSRLISSPSVS